MRRLKQPAVLGEMIGGILLGPTLLGMLFPSFYTWLFNSSADVTVVRDAMIKLGMLFFLFIAGLEVGLPDLHQQGERAATIGLVGTLVPIAAGVALVYLLPGEFWGPLAGAHLFAFSLFIGMNLANSANPVIARILMDLGLLNSEIGTVIMTATIFDDLVNWTLFAIVLSEISPGSDAGVAAGSLPLTMVTVLVFFAAMLGLGRKLGPPGLDWIRSHVPWPGGFIAVTALMILLAGAAAEWLGIHAFFGAFLIGTALGGHDKERNEAHEVIAHFVMSFFAPIYFVSIGMAVNFIDHFDVLLAGVILLAACVSKIGAVVLGARLAGMQLNREVWAIAFGLNARGATGMILAGVGLANGVIDGRIFVAIVVMALVTSLMSAPMMTALHHPKQA